MSRSPLAYPLVRPVDGDIGGAADLQTDVMRFMAILALCLVAIFALVQSIPLAPPSDEKPAPPPATASADAAPAPPATGAEAGPPAETAPSPARQPAVEVPAAAVRRAPVTAPAAPAAEPGGFTLRFESDRALARLVAAGQVGFFAIERGRAKRMSVRDSLISFWDASQPERFHEMERGTVPKAVIDALAESGVDAGGVSFGVTLPRKLSEQLDTVMQAHSGGALVIGADGSLTREAS